MQLIFTQKSFQKTITLIFILAALLFSGASVVRGETQYCVNAVTGVPLPDFLGGGTLGIGVSFGDACRRAGGVVSGVLPQYIGPAASNAPVQDVNSFIDALVTLVQYAQIFFWILAVAFGLYAAFLYLFSQGSKEQLIQARRVLVYTVVAIVVAILAYAIPGIVDSFFT